MKLECSLFLLAACIAMHACSKKTGGGGTPVAGGSDASASADPPPVSAAKNWKLEMSAQFFGTALGPLNEISIGSNGAITVKVDGRPIADATLPKEELDRLGHLLADPKLAALPSQSSEPDVGQHIRIKITGDVNASRVGPSAEMAPLIREVDRLRDLVAPPEDFKLTLREPPREILVSSNGFVEIQRDGKQVATHFYPMSSLDSLRGHLAAKDLRPATSSSTGGGQENGIRLTMTGDMKLDLGFDGKVTGPAVPVADEVRRLAGLVEAAQRPPKSFTLVYKRQEHGAGLGPLRTITIRSADRSLLLEEEGVKSKKRRTLTKPELSGLARALVDPAFRSSSPTPPSSEGMYYHLQITGDQPLDQTYRVNVPQPVVTVIGHIDSLVSRPGP